MKSSFIRNTNSVIKFAVVKQVVRWSWRLLLVLVILDLAYLAGIWPQWDKYRDGPIQQSAFMHAYEAGRRQHPDWPKLSWNPVAIETIPQDIIRAVIVAEDGRFYEHAGIDLEAFKEAMEYNLSKKRMVYGGSTISQQIVKNLFLSASRNPLRKWHELLLTLGMERNLSKKRILELYLNLAEFGRGIYGVDAAAQKYWGVPVYRVTRSQAIELAATLPSPVKNNPRTATKSFYRRVKKIVRYF